MSRRAAGEGSISFVTRRRRRANGSEVEYGMWQVELELPRAKDGKRRKVSRLRETQQEAVQLLHELRGQIHEGRFDRDKTTVRGYLERWLATKKRPLRRRTYDFYRDLLERKPDEEKGQPGLVMERIGHILLADLAPLHVQNFVDETTKHYSADTAYKCHRVLKTALKQAVRWQLVATNACEAVDAPKVERQEQAIWSMRALDHFLDVAAEQRLYGLFYLVIAAGLRRGEILGLEWRDLKGSSLVIRRALVDSAGELKASGPKTKKGVRTVSLSPDVLEVLAFHRKRLAVERKAEPQYQATDLMFPSSIGTPINPRNLNRTLDSLQRKAKEHYRRELEATGDVDALANLDELFPHASMHDLRHLNVSLRRRRGQDAVVIAGQIGHTDPSFTMRLYAHEFNDEQASAAVNLRDDLGRNSSADNLN